MSNAVGVDGCRGGWIAVSTSGDWLLARQVEELVGWSNGPIYIDIPIGLPEGSRNLEALARQYLTKKSSVFSVPCRAAVYANDYAEANQINRELIGVGLSIQAWNICPKIREVDKLLRGQPQIRSRFCEAHPELTFEALNSEALEYSKKQKLGQTERLKILLRHDASAEEKLATILSETRRKDVLADDVLDAMAIALLGSVPTQKISCEPLQDEYGISIRMHMPVPDTSR